ncbi:MAG: DNA mismatch repair protein MutT [Candidatus Magasanikbacteria bacterium RIFOXYC12_FULL_32_21b]|nr:MAG: DNA mismatch repair protein MutT [Candidatus Magasanikbacteria bacterium RIFOXYC12_FULL_32_21b]
MPQAGLGTFIIRENKILFGKRKNSHGSGQWGLTGGHLEFGESWEECAIREAMEETGLKLENVEYFAVTNDVMPEDNKHYLTIFMRTKYTGGEAQLLEPDKFEEWRWCTWDDLPSPLFKPLENLIKKGFNPFEK